MVKVHITTSDQITAWRIRDVLARHPMLGGATAQIDVCASHQGVLLTGWIADERWVAVARRLTKGTAGRRIVEIRLRVERTLPSPGPANPL